jgi:adenylate cyclase class 2
MLEVEAKFPLDDWTAVRARLAAWGAAARGERLEADHYFNAPDRDFAATDEALRLRRVGETNALTYKGPKRDALTKTRTEIEVPFADGDAAAADVERMLRHLGYRPVAVVRKRRTVYEWEREDFALQCCLDEVERVGRYVEVEIVAPEERFEAARDVLLRTAAELGLGEQERRSYLRMLLEKGG